MKLEKWVSSLQITSKWISYASQALVTTDLIVTWQTDKTDLTRQWPDKPDKTVTSDWSNWTRQWPVSGQTWQDRDQWPVKPEKPVTTDQSNFMTMTTDKSSQALTSQTWQWPLTSKTSHALLTTDQTSQALTKPCDIYHWPVKPHMTLTAD